MLETDRVRFGERSPGIYLAIGAAAVALLIAITWNASAGIGAVSATQRHQAGAGAF